MEALLSRSLLRASLALATLSVGVTVFGSWAFAAGNRRLSDEDRGRELYDRHCLACHGGGARGDGPATDDLVSPVASLEGVVTEDNVDSFVDVVLRGRGVMPGFEASFDKYDARRVLRHTARLAAAAPPKPKPPVRQLTPPTPPTDPTDTDSGAGPETDTDAP